VKHLPAVLEAVLRGRRIDLHAAYRIGHARRRRAWRCVAMRRVPGLDHRGVPWLCPPIAATGDMTGSPAYIPLQGMVSRAHQHGRATMHDTTKAAVITRLKRIEGQVGGLQRMVAEDRYCVDLLTQIDAVRAALHKVEEQVLRDHVSHCVAGAFASGDVVEQRHKVEELIATIARMTR
jgi:DNA-binding FrmR family transcriptional regulator